MWRSLSWTGGISERTKGCFVRTVCVYDEIAEQIWRAGEAGPAENGA
jgi:hypothetical protein